MERDILHLFVPALPIAIARLEDAALRERPVAVASGRSDRALLQWISAEAGAEGVCEGMPLHQARRLCPGLHLLHPAPEKSARAMDDLAEIAGRYSPLLEPGPPGHLFLDMTGSRRLFGPGRDAASRLQREIGSRMALPGLLGVAGNKLVSRIAAEVLARPGVCDVLRGGEFSFLAPLPVSVLPGVGSVREKKLLEDLHLTQVGQIAALSPAQLRLAVGSIAPLLHQRARGIDPSPVRLPPLREEITEESVLTRAENDDPLLLAELCRLAEYCGWRLRQNGKEAVRLALTLDFMDGAIVRRALSLPEPSALDEDLIAAAERLFEIACRRRVRLKRMRLECGVRPFQPQLCFFAPSGDESRIRLQEALDRIRAGHGREAIRRGRAMAAS